jgi:hypothetical protein
MILPRARNKFKHYLVLFLLITVGAFFFSQTFIQEKAPKLNQNSKVSRITFTPQPTPIPIPTSTPKTFIKATHTSSPSPTYTPYLNPTNDQPTPIPTAQSLSSINQQSFQVSLTVIRDKDDQIIVPPTQVSIPDGANQCDVLSKALEQGKITQLNMRYDSNYKTYAVYQINGLGKENSIWWVYKVNGQSPNQGCSYIKANSGDNIEWRYIGT